MFTMNCKIYIVKEGHGCLDCAFYTNPLSCREFYKEIGNCSCIKRKDGRSLNFEEVLKIKDIVMKPFNLEKAKAGKPVCTRKGYPVRIICFDRVNDESPIVALITTDDGTETIVCYNKNGMAYGTLDKKHSLNLMMKPEKKQGWINVYRIKKVGSELASFTYIYPTKEEALECAAENNRYIGTFPFEWEE